MTTPFDDLAFYCLNQQSLEKLKKNNCVINSISKILKIRDGHRHSLDIYKNFVVENLVDISNDFKCVYLKEDVKFNLMNVLNFDTHIICLKNLKTETIELISKKEIVLIIQRRRTNQYGHMMTILNPSETVYDLIESGELLLESECTVILY